MWECLLLEHTRVLTDMFICFSCYWRRNGSHVDTSLHRYVLTAANDLANSL